MSWREGPPVFGSYKGTGASNSKRCPMKCATVQVMKRGITLPFAPPDRLREAETVPLHPAGRLHTLR
jgi:hypothetical protein